MRFLLGAKWVVRDSIRITVKGIAVAGRIVQVLLNGEVIGDVQGDGVIPRESAGCRPCRFERDSRMT